MESSNFSTVAAGSPQVIPPRILSALRIRLDRIETMQRRKRSLIRAYGLSRGLYELDCRNDLADRRDAAYSWREARTLIIGNGFEPRRVVRLAMAESEAFRSSMGDDFQSHGAMEGGAV